ncbi:MAG TPA: hypothetical protein VH369_14845 [Bryobacteraceae bacterium]
MADSVIRQVALDFVLVRRLDGAGNNQSDERDDQEKPIHITVTGSSFHPVRLWPTTLYQTRVA